MSEFDKLSDRELDALVAEKVMGEPRPPVTDCNLTPIEGRQISVAWFHVHNYENGDICEVEPRRFSASIAAAFTVEDRVAELGLQTRYVLELAKIVDPRTDRKEPVASLWWAIVHATPRQRCLAALSALKEKE